MSATWMSRLLLQPARLALLHWALLGLCAVGAVTVSIWVTYDIRGAVKRVVPTSPPASHPDLATQVALSERVMALVRERGLEGQLPVAWAQFVATVGIPVEAAPDVAQPLAPIEEVVVLRGPSGLVGVVNGEVVRRGDLLSNGARVVELSEAQLVVQGRDGQRIELNLRSNSVNGRP